jgi:hypothetical protein
VAGTQVRNPHRPFDASALGAREVRCLCFWWQQRTKRISTIVGFMLLATRTTWLLRRGMHTTKRNKLELALNVSCAAEPCFLAAPRGSSCQLLCNLLSMFRAAPRLAQRCRCGAQAGNICTRQGYGYGRAERYFFIVE